MPGYVPCPYSLVPDARGEVHPHQAGEFFLFGRRYCAVCERRIDESQIRDAELRAEARAELLRITGRAYWLEPQTPSDPQPGSGGSTPPGGHRAEAREEKET